MSIDLHEIKNPDGTNKNSPNVLMALGLSCYTEYWGKLLLGFARDTPRDCYEAFFKRLGRGSNPNLYEKLLNDKIPIYQDVRCGLVHSYAIDRDCAVLLGEGSCGICYDVIRDHYDFYIKTYFKDFKNAVNSYIEGLNNETENLLKLNNAMKGKPLII